MTGFLLLKKPDGTLTEASADADGNLKTTSTGGGGSSEVTGPGGEELATEVTVDRTADAAEALALAVAPGGVPAVGQDALAIVNVDPGPTFTAAPDAGTTLPAVYLAGSAPFMLDRFGDPRATILEANSGDIATSLSQLTGQLPEELAASGGLKTELVAPLPAGTNAIGTVEVTASALPNGAATEAKQDAGNASLESLDAKAPALVGGRVPVDGSGVTQPVSDAGGSLTVDDGGGSLTIDAASLPLPTGAATSALQGAGLPSAFTAGGGVKVGLVDALPAGANAIGSVSVSSLPGSPAQEHVTAVSPHAARLTDGAAFYKGASAGDNMGADLRVAGAAVSNGNPVPMSDAGGSITIDTPQLPATLGMLAPSVSISTVVSRDVRRADASSYPALGTSFLLSATPAGVRRIEWRYTGGGTKYLLLMNSASVPPAITTWTGWYSAMTNGAGKSWFEFPVPVYCSAGVALAVSATEPVAGAAITLSVNAAENFGIPFYQLQ